MFNVIIDSDSKENLIGRQTMESLQLPVKKHLAPNTIEWIKATEKVHMIECYKPQTE